MLLPIVRRFGVHTERPCVFGRIGQEGLEKRGADARPVAVSRERPDVVSQSAVGPSLRLPQQNGCRPSAPLFRTEQRLRLNDR